MVPPQKFYFQFLFVMLVISLIPILDGKAQTFTVHDIRVEDNIFVPNRLEIAVGDEVRFIWGGSNAHNVAQVDSRGEIEYNGVGFRSGDAQTSSNQWILSSSYTSQNVTLYFICEPHVLTNTMRGEIYVGIPLPQGAAELQLGNLWGLLAIFGLLLIGAYVLISKNYEPEPQ